MDTADDVARGQLQALMAFAFSVIDTHPDKPALLGCLKANLEAAMVMALPSTMSDAQVGGIQEMNDRLIRYTTGAVVLARVDSTPAPARIATS